MQHMFRVSFKGADRGGDFGFICGIKNNSYPMLNEIGCRDSSFLIKYLGLFRAIN